VLVVDGDADKRESYRDSLTIAGWEVTQAEDGRDALVQLVILPSLLLTELRLSIIDGLSLCEIVRRDRRMSSLPILIVTGETRATEIARATRAGADTVLIKPSTEDCILGEMNRLLAASTISGPRQPWPAQAGRGVLVKAHEQRVTTTPEIRALDLVCPLCSKRLLYRRTYLGGVSPRFPERWDYYDCASGCGEFQYRFRTRKLRQLRSA
jgi:DNA-binding response OmpR family regulator